MDLSGILGKAAPWLAAAAAGPAGLAGMAIKTIAEAVNAPDHTVESITAAIAGATPEQVIALKNGERDFQLRMKELGISEVRDLEQIAAGDRDSARKANVSGNVQNKLFWLSMLLLTVSLGSELTVLFFGYPKTLPDIVVGRVLGLMDSVTAGVMAYWYGTTHGSAQKTEMLAQAQPIK